MSHSCTLELLVAYAPCGKVMVKMAKVIENYWIAKTVIIGGTFVALMLQISKEDAVKKKKVAHALSRTKYRKVRRIPKYPSVQNFSSDANAKSSS